MRVYHCIMGVELQMPLLAAGDTNRLSLVKALFKSGWMIIFCLFFSFYVTPFLYLGPWVRLILSAIKGHRWRSRLYPLTKKPGAALNPLCLKAMVYSLRFSNQARILQKKLNFRAPNYRAEMISKTEKYSSLNFTELSKIFAETGISGTKFRKIHRTFQDKVWNLCRNFDWNFNILSYIYEKFCKFSLTSFPKYLFSQFLNIIAKINKQWKKWFNKMDLFRSRGYRQLQKKVL